MERDRYHTLVAPLFSVSIEGEYHKLGKGSGLNAPLLVDMPLMSLALNRVLDMLKVLLLVLTFASVSTASFASSFLLSCLGD